MMTFFEYFAIERLCLSGPSTDPAAVLRAVLEPDHMLSLRSAFYFGMLNFC